MMKTLLLALLVALGAPLPLLPVPQQAHRKASPFDGLRWAGDQPEVELADTWYRPISIDGVSVADLLAFCAERWPGKREKRFGEDLVEAMALMGTELGDEVALLLVGLEDGQERRFPRVKLSEAKRNAIRDAAAARRPSRPEPRSANLAPDQAREDLAAFRAGLTERFAYLGWKGLDLAVELREVEAALGQGTVSVESLARHLHVLLARFGDGHARVSGGEVRATRWAPLLLVEAAGGVVALQPDRSGFLDPKRPFVRSLDGRPVAAWIEDLRPWITDGSPQLVRTRALSDLRELAAWRRLLGHPAADTLTLELSSAAVGKPGRETRLAFGSRRPLYGDWPRTESSLLEGDLGYLRLPVMDDRVPDLRRAMAEFRHTRGLVVDVRGNGGGSRELLLALAGYLFGPEEPPRVGNVAAYRLAPEFDADHLAARFLFRADDRRWTPAQRAAIERVARDFAPEWRPGPGFSDWHYLVLDRTGHPQEYFYDRPVVVLSDAGGFSATDIFLGALSGHPRVTLMGAASGGGSARVQSFVLPHSGLEVRCASMASFRPDGRLYDGRGIEVDREVPAQPEDFLLGGPDHVLAAACEFLR